MARKRFHNLKRPKIRQDWSKWTLYNLAKAREPFLNYKTLFQQKWEAKKLTRAYHGNQVRERKWEILFDRRLPAVLPMDATRLATTDGSQHGSGRGGGVLSALEEQDSKNKRFGRDNGNVEGDRNPARLVLDKPTPYMHMTYWPMERRLDTAVWRALFASSALQARQFVVHGGVRVNGKRMRHPGYLLNPGDMFQVDPERVLYATGARKFDKDSPETRQERSGESLQENEEVDLEEDEDAVFGEGVGKEEEEVAEEEAVEETEPEEIQDPKKALRNLLAEAKDMLADPKEKAKMSGKQKQAMRAFTRQVKSTMSKIRGSTLAGEPAEDTVEDLQATLEKLLGGEAATTTSADLSGEEASKTDNESTEQSDEDDGKIYPHRDARLLRKALDLAIDSEGPGGPPDASKPYATPWQPREYMSAFAFIPRYLEVNHKICSAVYLRHPVARPGLAEVPSPYGESTYELAHQWYLRRR